MAKDTKWIQKAIGKPGALHKALGIPLGQKIGTTRLTKASHSSNPTIAREARLALTLGHMHKKNHP